MHNRRQHVLRAARSCLSQVYDLYDRIVEALYHRIVEALYHRIVEALENNQNGTNADSVEALDKHEPWFGSVQGAYDRDGW